MKLYWDIVNKVIDESDIIIEVLDARFPEETRNLEIEKKIKRKRKKLIYVLNKSDLLKERFSDLDFYFKPYVFISAKNNLGTTILRKMIFDEIEEKPANIGVVGYPNTGKSSLINVLKQRKAARTSPIPGFTKGMQKIKLVDGVYLWDTPGVIPFMDKDELKHTLINVKDPGTVEDPDLIAMNIISIILNKNKKILEEVYKIEIKSDNAEEVLKQIAIKFNWLKKKGEPNLDLTSRRIISDFQKGKIII